MALFGAPLAREEHPQLACYAALPPRDELALIQEVAHGNLLRTRRQSLHGAVARALESADRNRDEDAAPLAHHFEHAGEVAEAVQAHARAAGWIEANDAVKGLRQWTTGREETPRDPVAAAGSAVSR